MIEYKGMFYGDEEEKKYYEGGAHFKYSQLMKALKALMECLPPERLKPKEKNVQEKKINNINVNMDNNETNENKSNDDKIINELLANIKSPSKSIMTLKLLQKQNKDKYSRNEEGLKNGGAFTMLNKNNIKNLKMHAFDINNNTNTNPNISNKTNLHAFLGNHKSLNEERADKKKNLELYKNLSRDNNTNNIDNILNEHMQLFTHENVKNSGKYLITNNNYSDNLGLNNLISNFSNFNKLYSESLNKNKNIASNKVNSNKNTILPKIEKSISSIHSNYPIKINHKVSNSKNSKIMLGTNLTISNNKNRNCINNILYGQESTSHGLLTNSNNNKITKQNLKTSRNYKSTLSSINQINSAPKDFNNLIKCVMPISITGRNFNNDIHKSNMPIKNKKVLLETDTFEPFKNNIRVEVSDGKRKKFKLKKNIS